VVYFAIALFANAIVQESLKQNKSNLWR